MVWHICCLCNIHEVLIIYVLLLWKFVKLILQLPKKYFWVPCWDKTHNLIRAWHLTFLAVSRLDTRLLEHSIPSWHLVSHFWMLDIQVCSIQTRKIKYHKVLKPLYSYMHTNSLHRNFMNGPFEFILLVHKLPRPFTWICP